MVQVSKVIAQRCCCAGQRAEVPVVVLVVEGGYTTLLTAFKAIETETPVLVLAGSGRTADFIAKAYEKHEIDLNRAKKTTSKTNFKWYFVLLMYPLADPDSHLGGNTPSLLLPYSPLPFPPPFPPSP